MSQSFSAGFVVALGGMAHTRLFMAAPSRRLPPGNAAEMAQNQLCPGRSCTQPSHPGLQSFGPLSLPLALYPNSLPRRAGGFAFENGREVAAWCNHILGRPATGKAPAARDCPPQCAMLRALLAGLKASAGIGAVVPCNLCACALQPLQPLWSRNRCAWRGPCKKKSWALASWSACERWQRRSGTRRLGAHEPRQPCLQQR